jgi:hypothetical protein
VVDPELDAAALLDDARAREAAESRARERWLREQATAGATFAGTLLDLCEQGVAVTVRMATGRAHRGQVAAVGDGVVVVRAANAPALYARTAAIVAVRPTPGSAVASAGDRTPPATFDLATLLADVAPLRPRVALFAGAAEPVAGELRAVGADVATVALEGPDGGVAHVHLSAVTEAVVYER